MRRISDLILCFFCLYAKQKLSSGRLIITKEEIMRLDKYLKVTRLIKRRTVANEACDAGKVMVNDKIARASYDVKVGDVITITLGQKPLSVKVTNVTEHVTKDSAADNYTVISQ